VSKIKGNRRISAMEVPIFADAMIKKNAYVNAGINKSGEISNPKIKELATPKTVNGGARYR